MKKENVDDIEVVSASNSLYYMYTKINMKIKKMKRYIRVKE